MKYFMVLAALCLSAVVAGNILKTILMCDACVKMNKIKVRN